MLEDDAAMGGKVRVVRNGVDTDYFDPGRQMVSPYRPGTHNIVFTGAMDYYANVEGVTWFVESVWPGIRARMTDAQFWIVGSNPTKDVLALASMPGVTVTGRVADIRPYVKFADVAVAPLRLARGIQNKVLEALAMNVPVVAAPQALQGLDENPPSSVAVAMEPIMPPAETPRVLKTKPPTKAPSMPTTILPISPKPPLFMILPPSQPATRPST